MISRIPAWAAYPAPSSGSSVALTDRSRTASIITTSRVAPTASLALPEAVRLRAVTEDSSTAITARSSTQASESGTRYGAPAPDAVDTQTSIASVVSNASVSTLRVSASRG